MPSIRCGPTVSDFIQSHARPFNLRPRAGQPNRAEEIAIDGKPLDTTVCVTPSVRRAEEWATVLAAIGIRHRLEETASGWAVAGRVGKIPRHPSKGKRRTGWW